MGNRRSVTGKRVLQFFYGAGPIPTRLLRLLRVLSRQPDALVPDLPSLVTTGAALRNPWLATELQFVELGHWGMTADTLDLLESQIIKFKPSCVLELGSGASTVCLARYMKEQRSDGGGTALISFEEDESYAAESNRQLEKRGLDDIAQVYYVPVKAQPLYGATVQCYDFTCAAATAALQGRSIEFLLVDGPKGRNLRRYATLPLLAEALSIPCQIYLDDGYRDDELTAAKLWRTRHGATIQGLYPVGKGLIHAELAQRIG